MANSVLINGHYHFDGSGGDSIFFGSNNGDFLVGGGGNDYLAGRGGDDLIIGGGFSDGHYIHIDWYGGLQTFAPVIPDSPYYYDGSDTLIGGDGNDTLIGGGWDDGLVNDNGVFDLGEEVSADVVIQIYPSVEPVNYIWAGAGHDLVVGANFTDIIGGGSGDDDIFAGGGNDIVYGGTGEDYIWGEAGADDLYGGSGNDTVFGGSGDDIIGGGSGHDDLFAEGGDDTIYGGSGDDIIEGGAGNDLIYGGAGWDTLRGGSGDDDLFGGTGDDVLIGGSGEDYFYFSDGHGFDIIKDFDIYEDTLVLTGLSEIRDVYDLAYYAWDARVDGVNGLLIETTADDTIFLAGVSYNNLWLIDAVY